MAMALTTHRWTLADLDRLPEDGNRYEVVDGALFVTPPPSVGHERLHHLLAQALVPYLERHDIGELFHAHHAVIFGESQVEPDLIIVPRITPRATTWQEMPKPILIVEVLSPTTARRDRIEKRQLYQREGIPEYWIVDGESRVVRVTTPSAEATESETLHWQPPNAPAPLDIDLAALFEAALGAT